LQRVRIYLRIFNAHTDFKGNYSKCSDKSIRVANAPHGHDLVLIKNLMACELCSQLAEKPIAHQVIKQVKKT